MATMTNKSGQAGWTAGDVTQDKCEDLLYPRANLTGEHARHSARRQKGHGDSPSEDRTGNTPNAVGAAQEKGRPRTSRRTARADTPTKQPDLITRRGCI